MIGRRAVLGLGFGAVGAALTSNAFAQRPGGPGGAGSMPPIPQGGPRIIDVHAHFLTNSQNPIRDAVQPAVEYMDRLGIAKALVMPPPQRPGQPLNYDYDTFLPLIRAYPQRFGFLGGGGTLNVMIHRHGHEPTISESTRQEFEAVAQRILAAGAVGFGEITAHHVSYFPQHPYESVRANHPLMLLLADIAARNDVPLDLHMDPVPQDMPPPLRLAERGGNNPQTLAANIPDFEKLLAHNRNARIIWAHAGRDTLGTWTVDLSRRLLATHPNLFMSLSLHPPGGLVPANSLLEPGARPNQAWIDLVGAFPERFVVGSDYFHQSPSRSGGAQVLPPPSPHIRIFVNALPDSIGTKVAHENAMRLYRIALT